MGEVHKGKIASISGNMARVVPLEAGAKPTAKLTIPEPFRGALSKGLEVIYIEFADFTGIIIGRVDGEVSGSGSGGGGNGEGSGGEGGNTEGGGSGSVTSVPIMSADVAGIAKVGENLKIDDEGRLSVDTTDTVGSDNTKPITSAAVDAVVGNIEAILETI